MYSRTFFLIFLFLTISTADPRLYHSTADSDEKASILSVLQIQGIA